MEKKLNKLYIPDDGGQEQEFQTDFLDDFNEEYDIYVDDGENSEELDDELDYVDDDDDDEKFYEEESDDELNYADDTDDELLITTDDGIKEETKGESESEKNDSDLPVQEIPKKKRGRKPKNRIYFGEEQELAVLDYIKYSRSISGLLKQILMTKFNCSESEYKKMIENKKMGGRTLYDILEESKNIEVDNEEEQKAIAAWESEIRELQPKKEAVYNEKLAPAFKKMVEAIIRGNDFYIPNEEFIDTYRDTLSHLLSKADKFNINRGKRAYSYYSNICKNYLIGEKQKYQKRLIRNPSYDALEMDFANDINYSTSNNDKGQKVAKEEVGLLSKRIQQMIDSPDEFSLKETEIKLGKALINLLENWDYVLSMDEKNSQKLNKSVVLLFLRDQTGLDTKGIRDNLKKFKKEFLIIKNFVITQ